jgi:hypothetical protein
LRKPGGAAQLGEANPVWVAVRFCKRRRATNPMEGGHRFVLHVRGIIAGAGDRHRPLYTHYVTGNRTEDGACQGPSAL